MRKQQQIWLEEHQSKASLPSMAKVEPATGVADFAKYLLEKGVLPPQKIIDVGCGKGRNAVHLAEQGYDVYALDFIQPALDAAKQLAADRGVGSNSTFVNAEIDSPWPFDDGFFDLAIDSFSSIDIETKSGREICRDELLRTLKPGGRALVTVVSSDDEWEQQLMRDSPAAEPNSTYWPQNGKFQKNYDEPELREFYRNFEILELRKRSKPAFKLGREYTATNFWLVLKKS